MTVTPIKTKAEQQLATHFEAAAPQLPGGGWVPAARRAAFAHFAALGLPHRRLEAWKYTDLRSKLAASFPSAHASGEQIDEVALVIALGVELSAMTVNMNCIRLLFVDGVCNEDGSTGGPRQEIGYRFERLSKRLAAGGKSDLEVAFSDANEPHGDALCALNAAFATDGACLRIEENVKLTRPIHLVFYSTSAKQASTAVRNIIEVGKGAAVTLIESYVGTEGPARHTSSVTQLRVGEGATVEHIKLLGEGSQATLLCATDVEIEAGANYRAFQLVESPALARNDVNVTFRGEGASFTFNAAMLGRGKSHMDTTMVIDHAIPKCTSRELVKGVLDDESRGIFQGKVIVRPDAQKSDGKQSARALLLSPNAEFDSKPELEIYADDVICGHGSTAAELDEDQVFYLMARGIPRAQARALLIEAFAAEAIEAIEYAPIREAMRGRLQAWLAKSGA